jgi:hypothetical protein
MEPSEATDGMLLSVRKRKRERRRERRERELRVRNGERRTALLYVTMPLYMT